MLLSIVVVGSSMFYTSLGTYYTAGDIENITKMSNITGAQDLGNRMRDSIIASRVTNIDVIDIPFMVISGGYNALLITFDAIDFLKETVSNIVDVSFLDLGWILGIVSGIAAVIVSFTILSALMKWGV